MQTDEIECRLRGYPQLSSQERTQRCFTFCEAARAHFGDECTAYRAWQAYRKVQAESAGVPREQLSAAQREALETWEEGYRLATEVALDGLPSDQGHFEVVDT